MYGKVWWEQIQDIGVRGRGNRLAGAGPIPNPPHLPVKLRMEDGQWENCLKNLIFSILEKGGRKKKENPLRTPISILCSAIEKCYTIFYPNAGDSE